MRIVERAGGLLVLLLVVIVGFTSRTLSVVAEYSKVVSSLIVVCLTGDLVNRKKKTSATEKSYDEYNHMDSCNDYHPITSTVHTYEAAHRSK